MTFRFFVLRLKDAKMPSPSDYQSLSTELLAEFAAGAGHDLNNPLAIISGRAQLMIQNETDPEKRADLAVILTQVERAKDMIADLRLVARPPLPEKSAFLACELLKKLYDSYETAFDEQKIDWKATAEDGLTLFADPVQMMILFRALIQNSLRALGGAGEISIEGKTSMDRKLIEFRVCDSGPGIPLEIQPYIFEPYYSSYQSGRGLGFGLTKARIIARLHGGDVTFDETEPKTTFLVTLENRSYF